MERKNEEAEKNVERLEYQCGREIFKTQKRFHL
jgi:hypothetical protein